MAPYRFHHPGKELLAQVHGAIGPNHFGQERRESAEERARRIVQETLWDVGSGQC